MKKLFVISGIVLMSASALIAKVAVDPCVAGAVVHCSEFDDNPTAWQACVSGYLAGCQVQ